MLGLFCLVVAGAAFYVSVAALVVAVTTGELPIFPVRQLSGPWPGTPAAPLSGAYLLSLPFYLLGVVIGIVMLELGLENLVGRPVLWRLGLHRVRRLIGFVLLVYLVLVIGRTLVQPALRAIDCLAQRIDPFPTCVSEQPRPADVRSHNR